MADRSDRQIIDDYIRLKSDEGWQVVARSESSVQLRRPKQASRGWIVLGFLLLPFWGIGLAVWGLVLIDYLTQDEKVAFYTVDDIRARVEIQEPEPMSMLRIIAISVTILAAVLTLVGLIAYLFA